MKVYHLIGRTGFDHGFHPMKEAEVQEWLACKPGGKAFVHEVGEGVEVVLDPAIDAQVTPIPPQFPEE